MLKHLAKLPTQRLPWLLLLLSVLALLSFALYVQHGLGIEPCVKCIYQRTAIIAIGLAAFVGLLRPQQLLLRSLAWLAWLVAAVWGYVIAAEHVQLQQAENSFFIVCEAFPNFPSWLPLHELLPNLFGAPGLCGDIDWQFAGLSMPMWMQIIFAGYAIVAVAVMLIRLLVQRAL
ncbi:MULTISPECIES: disulfide bond formation protein DsbB [Pseudidiomarina]|uniref:Disulfide bond formation protein B n=2 Tax=Pseudidiomarina TaxID=2800384 RepID=A0A368V4J5_9GAMM|nr:MULTISPECIES: disulfide bond formation protein DsbB [Pseudidiomarina]MDX1524846.1 disulfide bond formation protein DsbB [Pseudidiomarina maritima]PWW15938.1 thiol:disulfide interchange protein DsbB [Pseudidiomarina maritima]RBP93552.1 thiol:disulfide interchange protein DsbB [Pseudidiomarina tainanensis]RCW36012.1 thiol:disulfide interchange protein DsbB [Pseudidiomarina tainanensis]